MASAEIPGWVVEFMEGTPVLLEAAVMPVHHVEAYIQNRKPSIFKFETLLQAVGQ